VPRVRRDSSTRAEGRSVDAGAVGAENARTKQPRFESDHGGTGRSNYYSAANENCTSASTMVARARRDSLERTGAFGEASGFCRSLRRCIKHRTKRTRQFWGPKLMGGPKNTLPAAAKALNAWSRSAGGETLLSR